MADTDCIAELTCFELGRHLAHLAHEYKASSEKVDNLSEHASDYQRLDQQNQDIARRLGAMTDLLSRMRPRNLMDATTLLMVVCYNLDLDLPCNDASARRNLMGARRVLMTLLTETKLSDADLAVDYFAWNPSDFERAEYYEDGR